jgi:hypothetical protein
MYLSEKYKNKNNDYYNNEIEDEGDYDIDKYLCLFLLIYNTSNVFKKTTDCIY